MDARRRAARRGRGDRRRFVALAVGVSLAAAAFAAWPALRDADERYLALGQPGHGEAAAGDHLQLAWALWLPGHQLERGGAPWADPYSFRPVAEAPPNLLGFPLALPYWPLDRLLGAVPAYNLVLLLALAASGLTACWWLRALGLPRAAALLGGVAYGLAPYLLAQAAAGHLLGLVAALLPGTLLALERRRLALAAALLAAVPLAGQLHLALGAIPLFLGYAWARLERRHRRAAAIGAGVAAGVATAVWALTVPGSIASGGRSLAAVERYQAEPGDFLRRSAPADATQIEELVYPGRLLPLLALAGLVLLARERRRGLAAVLAAAAVVPSLLALGTNLPLYEPLWNAFPPLRFPRVPERLLPLACLALAALAAVAAARLRRPALVALLLVLVAADLRVGVFEATAADRPAAAYAALRSDGRLLELPVFRPGQHWGSVYLAYARRSPRQRPQGYSTVAERAADRWARANERLSCGRGRLPAGIRYVVLHRGLYAQSGLEAGCARRAAAMLRRAGWRRLAGDGTITSYERPGS